MKITSFLVITTLVCLSNASFWDMFNPGGGSSSTPSTPSYIPLPTPNPLRTNPNPYTSVPLPTPNPLHTNPTSYTPSPVHVPLPISNPLRITPTEYISTPSYVPLPTPNPLRTNPDPYIRVPLPTPNPLRTNPTPYTPLPTNVPIPTPNPLRTNPTPYTPTNVPLPNPNPLRTNPSPSNPYISLPVNVPLPIANPLRINPTPSPSIGTPISVFDMIGHPVPVPTPKPTYTPTPITTSTSGFNYPHYSQGDGRWNTEHLGFSEKSIKSKGCLVSSVASMIAGQGGTINGAAPNPSTMNQWLKKNNGFANGNDFNWEAVNSLGYKFEGKQTSRSSITEAVNAGKGVVLHVHGGTHWVLATGVTPTGYTVMDPGNHLITSYDFNQVSQAGIFKKK